MTAFDSLVGFLLFVAALFNLLVPVLSVITLIITHPPQFRALYR